VIKSIGTIINSKPGNKPGTPWMQASSYGSTVNSTTHSSKPVAWVPVVGNDLFLMVLSDVATVTTPSGWALNAGASQTTTPIKVYCFTKVAGSSEPQSVTVTLSASDPCAIIFIEWPAGFGTADDISNGTFVDSPFTQNISGTFNNTGFPELFFGILTYVPLNPHTTLGPWTVDSGYTIVATATAMSGGLGYDLVVCFKIETVSGSRSFNITSTFVDAGSTSPWLYLSYKSP
jgi:hypothetical protein